MHYPVWLDLTEGNFNATALPTAQLGSALFIEAGSVATKPGTGLTFTPLIETSAKAGTISAAALQFAQPEDVARQITPSGKKTIAALVTGKFKTAFPGGAPDDAPPSDAKAAPKAPAADFLKESKTSSLLIVVADTDWLFDDYSIHKYDFMGQAAAEPFNDNLAFAANAMDFLAGSRDLISIRGKGNSVRIFTVVKQMESDAEEKYKEKLTALEARINEVQSKLAELQGKKGDDGGKLLASPEATRAIEDFQKQESAMRAERRAIRLSLRQGIDSLENRLLLVNLLGTPLLVCAFGLWFYRKRRA